MDLTEDNGNGNSGLPLIPCARNSGGDHELDMVEPTIGDFPGDGKLARVVSLY